MRRGHGSPPVLSEVPHEPSIPIRTPKSANGPRSNSFRPDSPSTTTCPRGRKTQPAPSPHRTWSVPDASSKPPPSITKRRPVNNYRTPQTIDKAALGCKSQSRLLKHYFLNWSIMTATRMIAPIATVCQYEETPSKLRALLIIPITNRPTTV